MRCRLWVLPLTLVLLICTTAQAATTGQLSGWVVDDQSVPLPGVSVTASSPSQIGGEQLAQTDLQAYALFLKARHCYRQLDEPGLARADATLDEVFAIDPAYTPAWNLRSMGLLSARGHRRQTLGRGLPRRACRDREAPGSACATPRSRPGSVRPCASG